MSVRTIAVLVGVVDGETRDEAFRAALGLTLRGARLVVCVSDGSATVGAESQRARSLLAMMGHTVQQPGDVPGALAAADAIEIWGAVGPAPALAPPGRVTHLVRPGRQASCAASGEPVLHLPPVLDRDHADRLLDQLLSGGPVAVW
jgi:hypothetical protein